MRKKLLAAMLCLAMGFTCVPASADASDVNAQTEENADTESEIQTEEATESEETAGQDVDDQSVITEDESVNTEDSSADTEDASVDDDESASEDEAIAAPVEDSSEETSEENQEDALVTTQAVGSLKDAIANADQMKLNTKNVFNYGSGYDIKESDGLSYMYKYTPSKSAYYQFTLKTTKGKVYKYKYAIYSYNSKTGAYKKISCQTAGLKVSGSKSGYTPTHKSEAVLPLKSGYTYYIRIKVNGSSFSAKNPKCYFALKYHKHTVITLSKKASNGGKYVIKKCRDLCCNRKRAVSFSVTTNVEKTKSGNKAFAVRWAKKKEATGYQVVVSTSSTFKTYSAYKYTNSTTKATYKNLTPNKNYYVKVRCYYDKGGYRFISKFSKACAVKVKGAGTQATVFKNMTCEQFIAYIGPLCTADQKKTGVLASVTAAQMILESGWGKSGLTQNANNCFGIKVGSSKIKWPGGGWDGKSYYTTKTKEEYNGKTVTITDSFRKYSSIENSIADHSAYLVNSKNGTALRYAGIKGEKDYKTAFKIIKKGGYATSSTYVTALCSVVKRWNLTQYDVK